MTPRQRARAWFYVHRTAATLLAGMPLRLASALGAFFGSLASRRASARRLVVEDNLRHIAGPLDPTASTALVRAAFSSYGRYWTELASVARSPRKLARCQFDFFGKEHLERAQASSRGVVLALPHLGAWDIGGALFARNGVPITTVEEVVGSCDLFDWMVEKRGALGLKVLPLETHSARLLLAALRRGEVVALLADRDIVGDGIDVDFFGAPARVPGGPAALALRTGADLLPCAVYQVRAGHYRAVVRPPLELRRLGTWREDVARTTQELVRHFEEFIAVNPEQWHVFQPNWTTPTVERTAISV